MDGYIALETGRRRTLKAAIGCVGIGLHGGCRVQLTLRPAPHGTGIRFRRTDLGIEIPALYDHVADTRLCTVLALPGVPQHRIGTVEHVMAALAGCGVDDALVELDGPEVPILDGSAAPFVFLIDCVGLTAAGGLSLGSAGIEVLRTVRVQDGAGPDAAWAELAPTAGERFEASLTIDFPGTAIGRQSLALRLTPQVFRAGLADARTFTLAEDVARLRAAGLALGGSLANAVVVDGPEVLNPGGLRRPDEFVRHKMLDVVGDLALAGAPIRGRFTGHRSGHALNNRLLRALFADAANWRALPGFAAVDGGASIPVPAAAAAAVA
ncbi:UDP-3-O-acyl-N-acetylglucosamine deacetylase [Paracraurococcus ruber]|uniref:UDP-3-O-acyl-N-acetylglucosamine deacetylase n=1 Tax=Paracraurococcus ruber TaxID=77675 RepID=A0ABS1D612_9PROT|nr:UDP-3-O-acyl-N-acetylglucosamine deacetylase [Paracraurococcus ruber]MBK1661324.1 UDP-3-O-[3-hydroxymyristoyl] N-acetylglucosamine deacetylase [Paracraurococcus ruber]TDG28650.1 UDP-3-O-acyl-N-acetylglucosamine deacetylase [Paracraurococcus ruber]